MREVAIIGVGQTKFGKFPERNVIDMGREAAMLAIKDAGISPKDIQVAYSAQALEPLSTGQNILMYAGITSIEITNVQNGCAGGATAVRNLWKDIATGLYDLGIAIGVESITTNPIAGQAFAPKEPYCLDGHMGISMTGIFALVAQRQMYEYGATLEDFAKVSVKNHYHGSLNPLAQYNQLCSIEEVLNSRMIFSPITLLETCPISDGAAAVILCSLDIARKYTAKPVRIIGSALVSGDYRYRQTDITIDPMCVKAANLAYDMAGCGPEDIDLVEIHDAFAPEEIMKYEELGLCAKGEGIRMLRDGDTQLGGKVPFNPSGGLLACGHPLGASGVRNVGEIALHLRGQAGARQVVGAKVGLAHMLGGYVSDMSIAACGVHILSI